MLGREIKPVKEAAQDYATKHNEGQTLSDRIDALRAELKDCEQRYQELVGGWRRSSAIKSAWSELEDSILLEHDKGAVFVTLIDSKTKQDKIAENTIVSRVTPKRLYYRTKGSENETFINKDGSGYNWGDKINIEATIARYKQSNHVSAPIWHKEKRLKWFRDKAREQFKELNLEIK
jgi:hypothetical protein